MAGEDIERKATQPDRDEVEGGDLNRKSTEGYYNDKVLMHEARQGAEAEHSMSFIQAIKTYKRAAMWSMCKCRAYCSPHSCNAAR